MFSPRFGFNYDVLGDQTIQIRGGAGIFTSRVPLVWPGGSYTNNGVMIGGVYHRSSWGDSIYFKPQWDAQYKAADFGGADAAYGGQVDLYAEDFKFPQVLRANIAIDQKLPWGMVGTLEAIYTKTLNNVLYYNYNINNDKFTMTGGPDNRTVTSPDAGSVDGDYSRIMLGTNTNEGMAYNITAQLQKPFSNGLTANLAYTFGRSKSINDGLSSQNSSQWRYVGNVNGRNDLELSYSTFDMGHRIIAFVSYRIEYLKRGATTISLVYNGQSGERFSYVYDNAISSAEDYNEYDLIYVPSIASDINLIDITDGDGNVTKTASAQWTELDEYIKGDDYLDSRRGDYVERFGARTPFEHNIDLKFAQDIFIEAGGRRHTLQITFDVFNLGNLLKETWGEKRYVPYTTVPLIDFEGFAENGTTPEFTFEKPNGDVWYVDDSGIFSSRWQAQFGIRYLF